MIPGFFAAAGGGSGPAFDLKAGLVAWWDLEEASSTRVDSHGSYHLSPTDPSLGRALALVGYGSDAPSTRILTRISSPNLATGDFTIAGVFKTTASNSGIISRQNSTGVATERQYLVTLEGGVLKVGISTNGNSNAVVTSTGTGLNDGNLHRYIAWRDTTANTLNIEVDNGTVASSSFTGSTALYSATDPGLFLHGIGSGTYANGSVLDEIGIWTRMLSADERSWLHNGGAWRSYADL